MCSTWLGHIDQDPSPPPPGTAPWAHYSSSLPPDRNTSHTWCSPLQAHTAPPQSYSCSCPLRFDGSSCTRKQSHPPSGLPLWCHSRVPGLGTPEAKALIP